MTLHHKRVLITGANGGLGLATSLAAAREGATVVLACRTLAKAEAAAAQISDALPEATPEPAGGFDMLDPASIDAAVAALSPDPLDVVFLQAGGWVFTDTVQTTELNGRPVETTIAKNVVGAHATLRALVATGRLRCGARVVIIGGEGSRGVPGGIAAPSFTDVADFERYLAGDWRGRGPYVPVDALGVAKLGAALWARRLARDAEGELDVVWFSPGLIGGTGGTAGMPAWKEFLFQRVAFPVLVALGKAQWPQAAAAKCVDCLAGRVGRHGDLLGAPAGTALGPLTEQAPMSPLFTDRAMQDAMWRTCEAAAGRLTLHPSLRATA
jgi:NAD(P)-dependent dehydrogenase (short-subunit alcohol dehydrogenase family)